MRILVLLTMAIVGSCSADQPRPSGKQEQPSQVEQHKPQPPATPIIVPTVVKTFPHDVHAFTQGLTIANGVLFESTGQYGISDVRTVDLHSGRVVKQTKLGGQYFGEGSTVLGNSLYMLTWLNQEGFVFDTKGLSKQGSFSYNGEGWGLTTDGADLFMSNGSEIISVRNAQDFQTMRSIVVKLDGKPCRYLNELEWVNGELWSNVWQTDMIVCINPSTGVVNKVLNLASLYPAANRTPTADVLNGIAYDARTKAIYVTGKNWPLLYQIEIPN